jgi:hypothetical protein
MHPIGIAGKFYSPIPHDPNVQKEFDKFSKVIIKGFLKLFPI